MVITHFKMIVQSKVIAISGKGFTNVADTKIVIRPTLPGAFKILSVLEDTIRIQLKPGSDWLPNFVVLKDDKKVPLQVCDITCYLVYFVTIHSFSTHFLLIFF